MADDYVPQNYQDDLTTNDQPDPIMQEENDDPTEELGVNPNEFRDELNKYEVPDNGGSDQSKGFDDERERLEDYEQDTDSPAGDSSAQP